MDLDDEELKATKEMNGASKKKSKIFKNVKVEMETCYFDIEIDAETLEYYERMGIDINDNEKLVEAYLDDNFAEYVDLLETEDIDFEEE